MAILILALLELDVNKKLRILFLCKENSGTKSFADLLLWLDPIGGAWAHRQASWRPRAEQEQLLAYQI